MIDCSKFIKIFTEYDDEATCWMLDEVELEEVEDELLIVVEVEEEIFCCVEVEEFVVWVLVVVAGGGEVVGL